MTNDSFLRYAKEKVEKMITSLNINQSVTQNTIDYISKQLKTENDIVLLHEVTRDNIKKISENFKYFEANYPNTAYFKTIAVVKSKDNLKNIELQPYIASQKNRTIFLLKHHKKNDIITSTDLVDLVIGLHAPSHNDEKANFASVTPFWQSTIDLLDKINSYKCLNMFGINVKINDIIIAGDLNAYIPGTERKRFLNKLLSVGFVDLWIETNHLNNCFTYEDDNKGSRIDYCLINDESWKKYTIDIDDNTRTPNGFTDHSAIIITRNK